MTCAHLPESYELAQTYWLLIDDALKSNIDGYWSVCLHPDQDLWQSLDTVPLDVLKRIAMECVTNRLQKTKNIPPFVQPRQIQRHG